MFTEVRRILSSGKGATRKLQAAALLHLLLWPILLIPRLFWPRKRREPLADDCRILLIRIDGIGDLSMSSAIFPSLRRRFPGAQIDLLTSDAAQGVGQLFVKEGWINNVHVAPLVGRSFGQYRQLARELRAQAYDAAVDLRGDLRNVLLTWLAGAGWRVGMPATGLTYLLTDVVDIPGPHHQAQEASELVRTLGVVEMEPWPRLPLQAEHVQAGDQWLAEHGARMDRPICAFHLTAFYPTKIWPLERFLAVAKHLKQTFDAQILIVGGKADVEIAKEFAGKFDGTVMIAAGSPLILTAGLLARCAVLVGNDSGPAHVAAYVGCPVVVLFGRGNPSVFRPLSPNVTVLASAQPCDPGCHKICVRGASWCMLQHSPEVVIEAVERIMDQKWARSETGVYLTRSAPESVPAAQQPESN